MHNLASAIARTVAVVLLRTSTADQTNGIEAQRLACEAFARAHGITIAAWFEEHVSGAAEIDQRPGLLLALEGLRTHRATVLLVHKRDRLARDPVIASMIERECAKVRAVVQCADGVANGRGPGDELVRGIFDAVGRFERKVIAARTSAALQAKKARGERVGAVPYGFQLAADGVHVEPCPEESAVVSRVIVLRDAGESQRSIVAILASEGVTSRTGNPLGKTQVGNILAAMRRLEAVAT